MHNPAVMYNVAMLVATPLSSNPVAARTDPTMVIVRHPCLVTRSAAMGPIQNATPI